MILAIVIFLAVGVVWCVGLWDLQSEERRRAIVRQDRQDRAWARLQQRQRLQRQRVEQRDLARRQAAWRAANPSPWDAR